MKKPICSVCLCVADKVKELDLYITGSEGMAVCHDCEMNLVNHLRALRNMATRAKKEFYATGKANISIAAPKEWCSNCGHGPEDHDSNSRPSCWHGQGSGNTCTCEKYEKTTHTTYDAAPGRRFPVVAPNR